MLILRLQHGLYVYVYICTTTEYYYKAQKFNGEKLDEQLMICQTFPC